MAPLAQLTREQLIENNYKCHINYLSITKKWPEGWWVDTSLSLITKLNSFLSHNPLCLFLPGLPAADLRKSPKNIGESLLPLYVCMSHYVGNAAKCLHRLLIQSPRHPAGQSNPHCVQPINNSLPKFYHLPPLFTVGWLNLEFFHYLVF